MGIDSKAFDRVLQEVFCRRIARARKAARRAYREAFARVMGEAWNPGSKEG